jgi:eukaryotic-like serine/threonine-protein kinase
MFDKTAARLGAALADRYSIEHELGEGGMAKVYLAEDLKHHRKVALKVLKPELAAVVGAKRFLAEIEVTAGLQHPNILPLFDSGEADGFLFYVMPYIEGESLAERLGRVRQLPVDEGVNIARDVCDALQTAHEQGIIHRDIKPANILLSRGKPLVADFGIALAVSAAGGTRLTETGLSVGTPYYMSPEQATGDRAPGPESDIYSLGAVLYEMMAGEPPHIGTSPQAVLAKILTDTAERLSTRRETVPPNVEATALKALERLPADRFKSADEFARALGDPEFRHREQGSDRGSGPAAGLRRHWAIGWSVAALMTIVAGATQWNGRPTHEEPPAINRFVELFPEGQTTERVGSWGPALALSPSGTMLAYVAHDGDASRTKLYLRSLDEFEAHVIPGTDGGWSPFFSPDEEWIGFFADGKLRKVSIRGGSPRDLADYSFGGANLGGGTWGPDNTIIFTDVFAPGLWQVSAEGGTSERIDRRSGVATDDPDLRAIWPQLLPDGKTVLYTVGSVTGTGQGAGLAILSLETGEGRMVVEARGAGSARYSPSGHLVYARGGDLLAEPFDLDRLVTTGPPVTVVGGVMTGGEGTGHFDVSSTGTLAYVPGRLLGPARKLEWVDTDGNREPLALPPGEYGKARVSPLGDQLAYYIAGAPSSVWLYDLDRGVTRRLTGEQTNGLHPSWTPKGERLVFSIGVTQGLAWQPADGSGPAERLTDPRPNVQYPHSWAANGQTLIYTENADPTTHGDIWMFDPEGDREPRVVLNTASNETLPAISPDGRWMAYVTDDSGRQEVLVRPFPSLGAITQVSRDGGTGPAWSPDGSELYYRDASGDTVKAVSFVGQPTVRIGSPRVLFAGNYIPDYPFFRNYDVSVSDGRFLMTTGTPPVEGWDKIHVVLEWAESLKEQVPTSGGRR